MYVYVAFYIQGFTQSANVMGKLPGAFNILFMRFNGNARLHLNLNIQGDKSRVTIELNLVKI